MKKSILIIALAVLTTIAFGQDKSVEQKHPSIDTAKIKTAIFSDQSILTIYNAIETAKKGLPGSSLISAADATGSSQVLDGLVKQLAVIYNERHPKKGTTDKK